MDSVSTGNNQEQDDRNAKIYRIAIIILVVIIAFLTFFLITSRKSLKEVTIEREFTEQMNMALQEELDSVLNEYNLTKLEYDSILIDKDSIIQANAQEIQQLIARQADYNRIRRQLNGLREITQNYVKDIDSLVTINQVLKEENVQIREEIREAQQRTTVLAKDKEELAGKVEVASTLRAYQVSGSAIRMRSRDREQETDRAARAERLKVCYTLAENPIAPVGSYNVYVRIADPNGNILRTADSDDYAFVHEGDTLQYSLSESVNYQNEDLSSCLYWERTQEFEPGTYLISIFGDDVRLGDATVTLR